MKTENIITGNRKLVEMISVSEIRKPKIFRRERKLVLTISVSEFRKLKIFRKEQKIDANYFGFRNSETEIVSIYFQFPAENFQFPKFGNRKFSAGNGNWC